MQLEIDASEVLGKADFLSRASERMLEDLERRATTRGAEAVRFIQRRFRQGGTSASRTAQRTGKLYDAYDAEVERAEDSGRRGLDLRVGLIKPGESDEVLLYGRVHEGYNAEGNRVSEFVIVPRASDWLVFQLPPELGGQWVRTKRVVLKPRPTLPEVEERLPPYLQQDVRDAFQAVTVQ